MIRELLDRLHHYEIPADGRTGDSGVYLRRYFLFGNQETKRLRVMIHEILLSDTMELHDHPWNFLSIGLKGSYIEHTPAGSTTHRAPWVIWRRAEWLHRLELAEPVWTLVVKGPKLREWGFMMEPNHKWVPWRMFYQLKGIPLP